ncbi:GerAB/ArcD/ProY family transporter [Paenibacillus sp. GD4]|uniref:GerAB/ArcD/ProY family transporter n=1 Tax=Paenibacillus sp. GD4 TaxID=3068890 RepID=UPI002796A3C6|nr:GerAB/ArcD/ProY family transporter [Paenibacillus sp. GD4]MDQ1913811.1 GerAB/ArcD/ProY family transporter [Paenibacillus sp. GD4]
MNRYFYYLVLLNMLTNVISYVPQTLIEYRFSGTLSSMLISVPIGTLLMYTLMKSLAHLPQQDLPQILEQMMGKKVAALIKVYCLLLWFFAGVITIYAIADITIRYVNPDNPIWQIILLFVIVGWYIATRKSRNVLYTVEIVLFLYVPLITLIFAKSFINRAFLYDSVIATTGHIFTPPGLETLSAATYIFSGYLNMVFFNKVFQKPVETKRIWMFGLLGLGILLTSFYIPIGFHGADGVGDYTYPWVSTADSMRIELGIVERVMYIFIVLYTGISAISIGVHWHAANQLLTSMVKAESTRGTIIRFLVFAVLGAAVIFIGVMLDEKSIFKLGRVWLIVRLASEVVLVAFIYFAARRRRHEADSM